MWAVYLRHAASDTTAVRPALLMGMVRVTLLDVCSVIAICRRSEELGAVFRLQKLNRNKSSYEVHVLLLNTQMFACAFRFCPAPLLLSAVAAAAAVLLLLLLLLASAAAASAAAAAAAAAAAVAVAATVTTYCITAGPAREFFFSFQLSCENKRSS